MYWNHLLPYVACCGLLAAAGACGKSAPEAGDPPGEVTYTYDDAGNLIERTGSDGSHMTQEFIRLGSAAGGR